MSTSTRQMWERVLHESQTSLMREADAPTMTDAQKRRREKYVKALKKKSADLKSRYGNRWKQVMYATATKMAMQEAAPPQPILRPGTQDKVPVKGPMTAGTMNEDFASAASAAINFLIYILTYPIDPVTLVKLIKAAPVILIGLMIGTELVSGVFGIVSYHTEKFAKDVKQAFDLYTTKKKLTPQEIKDLLAKANSAYSEFGPVTKSAITRLSKYLSNVDLKTEAGKNSAAKMFQDLSKIIGKKNIGESVESPLAELTADQKKRREEILKGLKQNAEAFKANYGDEWEAVLDATATSMALEQPEEFEATLTEEVAEDITADEVAAGLKGLDKPTEKLTAAQINRELDTLETYGFVVTMRLGIARFTQAVSEMKRLLDLQRKIDKRKSALVHEIGVRYAPMGVHHRLPDEKQYNARPVTEAVDPFGSPDDTDPLRMKAASTFAREFADGPIVGQSPEEIVNNTIKAWFTQTPNSFTPDRMQAFGQGLDLLNKMQVAWDLSLIPPQFLPDLRLTTVSATLSKK